MQHWWQQWRQARWQRCDMVFLSSHVLLGLCLGFALYVGRAWQAQETQIQQTVQQQQLVTQSQAKAVQEWTAHTALAAQISPWVAQGALGNAPLLRWDELLASFQATTQSTPNLTALTWQFLPPSDFVENNSDQIKNQLINNDKHAQQKIDQIQFVTMHLHGAAQMLPELLTWLTAQPSHPVYPTSLPAELRRLAWDGDAGKSQTFTLELRLAHLPVVPQHPLGTTR